MLVQLESKKEYGDYPLCPDPRAPRSKESESEILLDAVMIITKSGDDTVRDTFEFSFPVNYDYSKEGE